jgi:hypothetical protein
MVKKLALESRNRGNTFRPAYPECTSGRSNCLVIRWRKENG